VRPGIGDAVGLALTARWGGVPGLPKPAARAVPETGIMAAAPSTMRLEIMMLLRGEQLRPCAN
jgi:hypothetical protein